ncbi:hypothetical protein B0O80DRAFT_501993 [Mortierella sp. GBAus27b]|nr:hypothetical protein B0O80DRAFT_501993 [Mortierella sp. GBAus27b]
MDKILAGSWGLLYNKQKYIPPLSEPDLPVKVANIQLGSVQFSRNSTYFPFLTFDSRTVSPTTITLGSPPTAAARESTLTALCVDTHIVSVHEVQAELRTFYTSKIFKIKAMHLKQARTVTLGKGISRLCKKAGLGRKLSDDESKPLFVVGDGEFGSRNTPIFHQRLVQFPKKKWSD